MPCHDCLTRREFLALSAAGVASTLAGCADAPTIPTSPRLVVTVGDFPGLADVGQLVKVGPSHAAKRVDATSFTAYSMFCTHQGCTTSISGQQFVCPCHGSVFNASGTPTSGPASRPLPTLPTSYDPGTDTLTIS